MMNEALCWCDRQTKHVGLVNRREAYNIWYIRRRRTLWPSASCYVTACKISMRVEFSLFLTLISALLVVNVAFIKNVALPKSY